MSDSCRDSLIFWNIILRWVIFYESSRRLHLYEACIHFSGTFFEGNKTDMKITRFLDRNLIFDLFRAPSKAVFFESGSRSVPSLELWYNHLISSLNPWTARRCMGRSRPFTNLHFSFSSFVLSNHFLNLLINFVQDPSCVRRSIRRLRLRPRLLRRPRLNLLILNCFLIFFLW